MSLAIIVYLSPVSPGPRYVPVTPLPSAEDCLLCELNEPKAIKIPSVPFRRSIRFASHAPSFFASPSLCLLSPSPANIIDFSKRTYLRIHRIYVPVRVFVFFWIHTFFWWVSRNRGRITKQQGGLNAAIFQGGWRRGGRRVYYFIVSEFPLVTGHVARIVRS